MIICTILKLVHSNIFFAKLPPDKQQKFIAWMNEYIMASAVRQRLMRDKIK